MHIFSNKTGLGFLIQSKTLHHNLRQHLVYLLLAFTANAYSGEISPTTRAELEHLFSYLETSGCQFNRNGSWYTAMEATAHIRHKYEYLDNKGLITTAEDFIEKAASQSSMTRKAYEVKCAAQSPLKSAPWFSAELKKYRDEKKY